MPVKAKNRPGVRAVLCFLTVVMQAKRNSKRGLWLGLTRLPLRPVNRLARDGGHQHRGNGENLDNVPLFQAHGVQTLPNQAQSSLEGNVAIGREVNDQAALVRPGSQVKEAADRTANGKPTETRT
jgi:hypothetical protein